MKMQPTNLRKNSKDALSNSKLQLAMGNMRRDFVDSRGRAIGQMPEYDLLKADAKSRKDHTLANLDHYLEAFSEKCEETGGKVHWAVDGSAACEIILGICKSVNAKKVTKSKSMIGEEIGINKYLEHHGIEPIETDLGEYIIQLADEPPSHITAPAIHKTKEEVAELFYEHHNSYKKTRRLSEIGEMCREAREVMRKKFFEAEIGITGANFLVAETGTSVIATNEGNGDLTQILPRIHIVVASIDKIVPTLEDGLTYLRLLARTASGTEITTYNTFSTGPRQASDLDGPEEFHVVLLDNKRSEMLAGPLREMLRCIRCGACLNHCPVYKSIGGHAYDWVYPGPMGSVLTPSIIGLEVSGSLPEASTFCGRCEAVCPMDIPLPGMMRHLREKAFSDNIVGKRHRFTLKAWNFFLKHPRLYHILLKISTRLIYLLSKRKGYIAFFPGINAWTKSRDLPSSEGKTFMELWKRQNGK